MADDEQSRNLAKLFLRDSRHFENAGRKLASVEGEVDIPVRGSSMGSALPGGTVVRVRLLEGGACGIGDIIVFRRDEQLVAHRIIYRATAGRGANHFITRGDARLVPDPPVPFGRVLGLVVARSDETGLHSSTRLSWIVRFVRSCAALPIVIALHLSPGLAARASRLFTLIERSPLLASFANRVRKLRRRFSVPGKTLTFKERAPSE